MKGEFDMDKVNTCIERIGLARGVNGGIITNEQIQALFIRFDLDEEEKQSVEAFLEKEGIIPVAEETVPQKAENNSQADKPTKAELRRKSFEIMLEKYRQDAKDDPIMPLLYKQELPILIKSAAELEDKSCRTAVQRIVKACMAVSEYRVREARKEGWVCGTHMSHVRDAFERWVKRAFSEDELAELIDCCVRKKEFTQEQKVKVMVLLHNTPKTIVHRRRPFILDD